MAEFLQPDLGPRYRTTILIVSVPDHQQYALCRYAELAGYQVIAVGVLSGFDWRLPLDLVVCEHRDAQIDAAKLCRYIRLHSNVPILAVGPDTSSGVLTAALDAGADMCLASPYDADHFVACIRAMLRRSQSTTNSIRPLEVGDFRVVKETQQASVKEREIRLSTQEFRLLCHLVKNPYRVLSHAELLHVIWGDGCSHKAEYLRPVVMSLRKKVEQDWQHPAYIRTAHKGGYFFVPSIGAPDTEPAISFSERELYP